MDNENSVQTPEAVSKVEVGSVWNDTDARRPRTVRVGAIDEATGRARVENVATGRKAKIRLDRFSPAHHMRKV